MQYDQIKELIQIFEHSDLNNMEVTLGDASVKLGRGMANAVEESPEAQMVQTAVKVENPVTDAAPTTVETEKTEPAAMKFMNEVISEVDGTITEILV